MGLDIKALADEYRKEVIDVARSKPFGQILREEREKRGLAQTEFAEMVGINRVTICKYEGCKVRPKFSTARALLNQLEVKMSDGQLMRALATNETEFTDDEIKLIRAYRTSKASGNMDSFWSTIDSLV